MKNTIDQLDLTAIYRINHPAAAECTFFLCLHGINTKTDRSVFLQRQSAKRLACTARLHPRNPHWPDSVVKLLGIYRLHLLVGVREVNQVISEGII